MTEMKQLAKRVKELENKIADIKANCDLAIEGRDVKIMELEKENTELLGKVAFTENSLNNAKAQIEKMKCCGNCRFSESDKLNGTFCHREGCYVIASANCKLWER